MRIAQIIVPNASHYDRKSQRIDASLLASRHEVLTTSFEGAVAECANVAHVYGGSGFDAPQASRFRVPYVASGAPRPARFTWRKPVLPNVIVSPLDLAEAVEDHYFEPLPPPRPATPPFRLGSFGRQRPGVMNLIEQTLSRTQRFRDDIEWLLFDEAPAPEDLAGVEAWVDPATSESDYDGFVAEAIVAGRPVVASRTPVNSVRLEKGRTGFLVPPGDPNELTHAILAALFKSEVASVKIEAARQTAAKFRPRHRLRALERIYEALIHETKPRPFDVAKTRS